MGLRRSKGDSRSRSRSRSGGDHQELHHNAPITERRPSSRGSERNTDTIADTKSLQEKGGEVEVTMHRGNWYREADDAQVTSE